MLPDFPNEKKEQAKKEIYRHIIRDDNMRGDLGSSDGMEMPRDLRNAILYESTYNECTWGRSNWTGLSGNGCRFTYCDFYLSKINSAALQHALFDSAVFHCCDMIGSNLAYSLFSWSIISHSTIKSSGFTGAKFNHVTLDNCKIVHSNFELCKFQDCTFRDMDFRNLALKYTFFRNVHMDDVALPFMQMPYTFGGLKYIFTTDDNIRIASMDEKNPNITVAEYKELLPQLIIFFTDRDDYFPLANCYMANEQKDLAEQANEDGIIRSASLHDFRQLYFYCIQASQELDVSREKRRQLYDKLYQEIASNKLDRAEYHEFLHYFPLIKQLMFDNPYGHPTLAISLHTNIEPNDFHGLGLLMRTLDDVAENCGVNLDSKHIEIRHNSPNIVGWFPTGTLDQLIQLLQTAWDVIGPILSEGLQNAANVVTLIAGISSFRLMNNTRSYQMHSTNALSKAAARKKKAGVQKDLDPVPMDALSEAQREVVRLRSSLLKQEQVWRTAKNRTEFPFSSDLAIIHSKFMERTKELISSGIRIDSIEIQLLDEHCDTLEAFYRQENPPA